MFTQLVTAIGGSRGLRLEDVSSRKFCVVYLTVRSSVGRGLRLEDVS